LSFRDDDLALLGSSRCELARISVGGIDFEEIVELRAETFGYQAVPDLADLEGLAQRVWFGIFPRIPNWHSS
jgi:hypothetical protein